jgi:hypothetical protein
MIRASYRDGSWPLFCIKDNDMAKYLLIVYNYFKKDTYSNKLAAVSGSKPYSRRGGSENH